MGEEGGELRSGTPPRLRETHAEGERKSGLDTDRFRFSGAMNAMDGRSMDADDLADATANASCP